MIRSFSSKKFENVYISAERTKHMEPILRAKVKIFFKCENLKKSFQ